MIVTPGALAAPAARLLTTLAREGVPVHAAEALPTGVEPVTLVVADGEFIFDFAALVSRVAPRPFRVLVLSRLGAHPDARTPSLQRLWRLEEHVRGGGAPTLTLRLAPLVGPGSPLVRRLARRPRLPRGGRGLLNPVAESDVIATVRRALGETAPWRGWYEVAGPEVWSLAELRDLAASAAVTGPGAWEPALDEIAEHRLAEAGPWLDRFSLRATPIRDAVLGRAA